MTSFTSIFNLECSSKCPENEIGICYGYILIIFVIIKTPHYYNVVVYEAIIVKGPFIAAIFGHLPVLEPNFDQIQYFEHGLLKLSYSKN